MVVTVYCSALFLEPWSLCKAAGAAAYVLQGKRRLPGHLKVFLDLISEGGSTHLPAPSMVDRKLRVLTGSGHARFPWLHIPLLACSQQLIKQQMSAAAMAPGSFPFILFYPALQRNALDSFNSLLHSFIFHLFGLSRRWSKCLRSRSG